MGLMRLAFPGVSSITVNKAGAAYAEAKSYEFRYEVPVYLTTASAIEAYIKQELGRNDFASVAAPSYIYIASPFGAGKRMVSAVGDIMGGESLFAVNNSGYHVMFAGRAARLPRAIGLPFEIGRSDEVVANTSGVQMLKYSEGSIIVWGGARRACLRRTPSCTSAAASQTITGFSLKLTTCKSWYSVPTSRSWRRNSA
ncbi:MAG: hypothetical protein HC942_23280 [Microcoleus sp. SU_5_6]|nr:hypothetical protein [Microcoleus sp. SU_5_6]